ncbi:DUF1372 family protein [Streptococcus pneumoniae]|nr:DUF1372 family protein [Streptococcus pneumoniae]
MLVVANIGALHLKSELKEARDAIKQLKANQVVIYQVDSAGAVMSGTITDKEIVEGRHTVTAGAYGRFLVTKEQYESLKVGDPIPEYLKKRGS